MLEPYYGLPLRKYDCLKCGKPWQSTTPGARYCPSCAADRTRARARENHAKRKKSKGAGK